MLFLWLFAAVYLGVGLGILLTTAGVWKEDGDWPFAFVAALLVIPLWPLIALGDWLDLPEL